MIRSMTGFGAASLETAALRAQVTARSLNHRFLDLTLHLPRRLQALEGDVKALVTRTVARGRVEIQLQASLADVAADGLAPNRALVASLVRALRDMQNEFGLEGGVSVSDLLRVPGALERVEAAAVVPAEVREALLGLVDQACEGLEAMRRSEGERLGDELLGSLSTIEETAGRIEVLWQDTRGERQTALVERVRALLGEIGLDETRVYPEVVRVVERHDVAEEIQRLRSHVAQARELMGAEAPAGKRLDFLAQELLREANTVGSKAADAAIVQMVVDLKAEIERFREQAQNVE